MRFLNLEPCVIWEPACGNGAMSNVLGQYGHIVLSSDIRNTGFGDGWIDFLAANKECDAIITNPPFNISEAFIRHVLNQVGTVAMVLKSQYWHAKKRSALFGEFPSAYVLPLTCDLTLWAANVAERQQWRFIGLYGWLEIQIRNTAYLGETVNVVLYDRAAKMKRLNAERLGNIYDEWNNQQLL